MWHTGKVLACGAVGPRFKPHQGQGFLGPIWFYIRVAHYSCGKAGWFSARTLSFHRCNKSVVVCEFGIPFHTRLGRFSPGNLVFSYNLKSKSFHISAPYFLVSRCVCSKPAWLPSGFPCLCVRCGYHTTKPDRVDKSRVTKKLLIIIIRICSCYTMGNLDNSFISEQKKKLFIFRSFKL